MWNPRNSCSFHETAMLYKDISGIILAGGRSRRYGRNKALVQLHGTPLVERVIRVLEGLFENVVLITNSPEEYAYLRLPMEQDIIKGLGPLGGIYTALQTISTKYGFFVACDMPFLNSPLISYIIDQREEYDVVAPKIDWKIEALHSLYRKTCLPEVERLIRNNEYQTIRFFDRVSVRYVEEDEVRRFDPSLRSFLNINRPEDLTRISRRPKEIEQ
jgi:molybdenum cofactor guanylyltransferase